MRLYLYILFLFLFQEVSSQQYFEAYLTGIACNEKKEYMQAVSHFTFAMDSIKQSPSIYINRGLSYYYIKDYPKALRDFHKAETISPETASFYIARCYAKMNDPQKAAENIIRHLNSKYRLPESSIKSDPAFMYMEKNKEWNNIWMKDWYSATEKRIASINYELKYNHPEKAIDIIENNLNDNSGNFRLHQTASLAYERNADYTMAAKYVNKAIALQKNNPSLLQQRALLYMKTGKAGKAVNDYSLAIKQDPSMLILYKERSAAYFKAKKYNEAENDIKYYLKFYDNDETAIYHCGNIYFKTEKYLDALLYYNKLIKDYSPNEKYFIARANTYLKTGTFEYAIQDYNMTLDLNPKNTEAWINKGMAEQSLGMNGKACSDWHQAKRYGDNKAVPLISGNCDK